MSPSRELGTPCGEGPVQTRAVGVACAMPSHTMSKEWQRPFVNVFKICGVEDWKDAIKEGDVKSELDRTIGRRVLKISGKISAVNFVQVPGVKGRALGLTGRYLYLQLKITPSSFYAVHTEVVCADRNTVRISLSNMFKTKPCLATPQAIQIPLQLHEAGWKIVALDMVDTLKLATTSPFVSLRSVQICSSLHIRNMFTSDNLYNWQTLPREMLLFPSKSQIEQNDILWLLKDLLRAHERGRQRKDSSVPMQQNIHQLPIPIKAHLGKSPKRRVASVRRSALPKPSSMADGFFLQSKHFKRDPYLQLDRVSGFTGSKPGVLKWVPESSDIVYAYNSTVISMGTTNPKQKFFLGHDAPVCSIVISSDGSLMATAQEGSSAMIRIWDFNTSKCLLMLNAHAYGISCMDVSPDGRALAVVGLDDHGKQIIAIWDISQVQSTEVANLVLKQRTDYHINCLKFSVFEEDHLMTCGVDSIRMYRLRNKKLHGLSIQLGHEIRSSSIPFGLPKGDMTRNIFTDIAFDASFTLSSMEEKRVYVATSLGAVFQVSYGKRCLECIYKLHDGAINNIFVSEGFCVTASDDKFVRVWPTDFSDFFLEVEHDSPVTNMSLSHDGLQIAVGTTNGTVGFLDVPSHEYKTLVRSHTDVIHDVAIDPQNMQFCTVSADGTVRVWHIETCEQLFQFDLPGQMVWCVAYHPTDQVIGCGCDDGLVRIFDVKQASLIQEHKQHNQDIVKIQFHPSGSLMFTGGSEGTLCVYDAEQAYAPVKYLSTSVPSGMVCMAMSPDGKYFATVGTEGTSVLLFDGLTLSPLGKIMTKLAVLQSIQFSPSSEDVIVCDDDSNIEVYNAESQVMLRHISQVSDANLQSINVDFLGEKLVISGGSDSLLRLWEYNVQDDALLPSQSFQGHTNSVKKIVSSAHSDHVISLGGEEAMYVWRVTRSSGAKDDDDDATGEEVANYDRFYASPESSIMPFNHFNPLHSRDKSLPFQVDACSAMAGCNGFGSQNMVWLAKTGILCYTIYNTVIVEDVSTQKRTCFSRQDQVISALAGNQQGTLLASGTGCASKHSKRSNIWLWDIKDKQPLCTYDGPSTGVQKLDFSACSKYLAAISTYPLTKFYVYDTHTGYILKKGTCSFILNDISWSHLIESPTFLVAGRQSVREFSVESEDVRRVNDYFNQAALNFTSIAYTENDNFVAGDSGGKLWYMDRLESDSMICVHQAGSEITSICSDSKNVALGLTNGRLEKLSRVPEKGWMTTGSARFKAAVTDASLVNGLSQGIVRTSSSTLAYVNTNTGTVTSILNSPTSKVDKILHPKDNKLFASVEESGCITLWQVQDASLQKIVRFEGEPCTGAVLRSECDVLLTCNEERRALKIYNFNDRHVETVTDLPCAPHFCHFSDNETEVLVISQECEAFYLLLETKDVTPCAGLTKGEFWVQSTDMDKEGKNLVMANSNWIEVHENSWDMREVTKICEFPVEGSSSKGEAGTVHVAFVSSKPRTLVYASSDLRQVVLLDYGTSQMTTLAKIVSPICGFHVSKKRTVALVTTHESTIVLRADDAGGMATNHLKFKRQPCLKSSAVSLLETPFTTRSNQLQILFAFDRTLLVYPVML